MTYEEAIIWLAKHEGAIMFDTYHELHVTWMHDTRRHAIIQDVVRAESSPALFLSLVRRAKESVEKEYEHQGR